MSIASRHKLLITIASGSYRSRDDNDKRHKKLISPRPPLIGRIGNTIRISVNGSPQKEIPIVKDLLKSCRLIDQVPNLIACPTCGRTQWDMEPVVNEIEQYLQKINKNITIAIMGCAVNGPGEAKHADIAIAGGKKRRSVDQTRKDH